MDRVISLLAALVGLIALGGAILVHINADAERRDLAAQIAEIRTSLRTGAAPPAEASVAELASAPSIEASSEAAASSASSSAPMVAAAEPSQAPSDPAAEISSLEAQVAELERENASQASALAAAQTGSVAPASVSPSSSSSAAGVAIIGADVLAPSSLTPGSEVSSAPAASSAAAAAGNEDCIPLGTRFVGKAGDKFAICRSKLVVKILGVSDGQAVVEGAGPIAAGGFGNLSGAAGCTVMVFTADVTGYADLRVTCQ